MIIHLYPSEERKIHGTFYKNVGKEIMEIVLNDYDAPIEYRQLKTAKSGNPMASQQSWKQKHKR